MECHVFLRVGVHLGTQMKEYSQLIFIPGRSYRYYSKKCSAIRRSVHSDKTITHTQG